MSRHFFTFIFLILFGTFYIGKVSSLKCWRCSSDSSGSEFCNDPFNSATIPQRNLRWAYVDCNVAIFKQQSFGEANNNPTNLRPVCKKMRQIINDKPIILRSCAWEDSETPQGGCKNIQNPSYIKADFCETCDTDGCNGI
ncbi:hypothetical protein PVAND_013435 [Polypedilum vanderplanki]|uniref:Protein quiver n=1 Tax=Polypedilum vanderplanki TaxID=319348 RepID=A0A9J6CQN4_POLVA|nr:hypothetical protein PVAND_013435 [Polypedilum vanderplanki]